MKFFYCGKEAIAKKPITWGMMREVRRFYLGSRSELTGELGMVVMHHAYDSRRPAFGGFTGRPYSVFDGQLRNPREEVLMHLNFSAGNSEESWRIQAEHNRQLFELLKSDWLAGRELPFGEEVRRMIPLWLKQFPEWLKEFEAVRQKKEQERAVLFQRRQLVRRFRPGASLKTRQIKKLWNQPAAWVIQAVAS